MAGSLAFLRQFESQIPSLEQQSQSLHQLPGEHEEEEKALDDEPMLLEESDDEDLVMEHL